MTEKANILRVKNGAKAVISLTHDDGNLATVEFMNEKFLENNLCGTVGLIGKNFASLEGKDNAEITSIVFDAVCTLGENSGIKL